MKNFGTIIDEIYEFIDELLGSIIPGIFFCSYFVFCSYAVVYTLKGENTLLNEHKYIVLLLFVIAYILGTMFRRSFSREPDNESATHIYFNSIPKDDNDFAFNQLVPDNDFEEMIKQLSDKIKDKSINIKVNDLIINERKKKLNIFKKAQSKIRSVILKTSYTGYKKLSKPYVQKQIKTKLEKRKKKLEKSLARKEQLKITSRNSSLNKKIESLQKEIQAIECFIKKHHLEKYCDIFIEYPYENLKDYLKDRKLDNLVTYVNWTGDDIRKKDISAKKENNNDSLDTDSEYSSDIEQKELKTARSKSKICNMKLYIKHHSPQDYGFLLKTEAHIRFMNAIWYANKYLSAITIVVSIVSIIMLLFVSAVLYFGLFARLQQHIGSGFYSFISSLNNTIKSIIGTTFKTSFEWKDSLSTFGFLILVSSAYNLVGKIIIKTIKNNFHYQRIREVVSVLYIYDLLIKTPIRPVIDDKKKLDYLINIQKVRDEEFSKESAKEEPNIE